jgi:1,4-alpha-glucan branching enzyme
MCEAEVYPNAVPEEVGRRIRSMSKTGKQSGKCAMTFVYEPNSEAKKVFLAGDFNGWAPAATRMTKRNGAFRRRMQLDPGEHHYKFVVDGEWQIDPAAMAQVPNDMGSMNSVVTV